MSFLAEIVLGLLEWGITKGGTLIPIWMKEWQEARAESRRIDAEGVALKGVQSTDDAKKAVEEITSDINSKSN